MPAHHPGLSGWSTCSLSAPEHFPTAENLKNLKKSSKNRILIKTAHLLGVIGIPAYHPRLPGSSKWPPTTLKHPCAAENQKYLEKSLKMLILIEITHFLRVLGMPAHHPGLPGSSKYPLLAPKSPTLQRNQTTLKNLHKMKFNGRHLLVGGAGHASTSTYTSGHCSPQFRMSLCRG